MTPRPTTTRAPLPRDPRDNVELSPRGDRRERAVPCQECRGRETANWSAVCDRCRGSISPEPAKPCKVCAAQGRLTWLGDDGSCRREDVH